MRCLEQDCGGLQLPKTHHGRELWDRMVEFAREPDGLCEYETGDWTRDKLFFLCHYLALCSHAMSEHPHWDSINYVDLFAGCGVCAVRCEDGQRRRYPGSALLAAGCKKPFTNLYLVEEDATKLAALVSRVQRSGCSARLHAYCDNANAIAAQVAEAIPPRSLTVAFVDPFSLDIHFEAIAAFARTRSLDLLILFADDMDLLRNVEAYYYPNPKSKLDAFLGPQSDWRRNWDQVQVRETPQVRQFFAETYLQQLATLGYVHTSLLPIPSYGRPLYRLVFASRNPLGLKFWRIAESESLGGDRSLFGIE